MNKIILSLIAVTLSTATFAQKVYKTNSAQIRFQPIKEEDGCVNNQVQSLLKSDNGQIAFSALIKGFKFKNSLLEDHFNENYMETTKFPTAKFQGFITNVKEIDFSKNGEYKATVKGNLTIHGVTKEVSANGTVEVNGGKVTAKSNFKVKVKDYGITGMYIGGKIAAEEDVEVVAKYE
jgi:hypothetical protein